MTETLTRDHKIMAVVLFLHPEYFKLDEEAQEKARKETMDEIFDLGLDEMGARIVFMLDHKDGVA